MRINKLVKLSCMLLAFFASSCSEKQDNPPSPAIIATIDFDGKVRVPVWKVGLTNWSDDYLACKGVSLKSWDINNENKLVIKGWVKLEKPSDSNFDIKSYALKALAPKIIYLNSTNSPKDLTDEPKNILFSDESKLFADGCDFSLTDDVDFLKEGFDCFGIKNIAGFCQFTSPEKRIYINN